LTIEKSKDNSFLLKDHPRPNINELPGLYAELDSLSKQVEAVIRSLPNSQFDRDENIILFEKITKTEFRRLIAKNPSTMVIAFTRVCGLSDREFSRLFRLKNAYNLRESNWIGGNKEDLFLKAIMGLLPKRMHLETFLYTFYKMWEEHQKRHYRGSYEKDVRSFFRAHGYNCEKITQPTEVNGAIPPYKPQVVMQIRTGVMKDLVKRAKEFSQEYELSIEHFPNAKFIVVFKIPPHELERREEIRQKIYEQRVDKTYDAIIFQDELGEALKKFVEWEIPRNILIQ